MFRARVIAAFRPLALFAAIALLATLWLTVVTGNSAGAAPNPALTPGPSTPGTPGPSPFPPGAPGDLHVTAITSASVTLAWTASTAGCCPVSGYEVTYTQAFNDVVWTQEVGNVTTVTLISNIRAATQYNFRVSAHDDLGHRSASSNSVVVVTPLSDTGPDTTPPAAPTGLTLGTVTPAGAPLSWSASTDNVGVTGYNVYRFDGLYISTLLATVAGTSYTAPLSANRDVFYVRARDAAGNVSIASNFVTVTPTPSTPPTTSPTPSIPPPACRVTYVNTSEWGGGFVADVKVTNTAAAPLAGWTLTVQFGGDQRVTSVWNASFSQAGATVTLKNLSWNRVIPARGSVSVGLLGRWTASNARPTAIALNGGPCTVE